jgi:hypothetical protein
LINNRTHTHAHTPDMIFHIRVHDQMYKKYKVTKIKMLIKFQNSMRNNELFVYGTNTYDMESNGQQLTQSDAWADAWPSNRSYEKDLTYSRSRNKYRSSWKK